jgi:hypothetical protein
MKNGLGVSYRPSIGTSRTTLRSYFEARVAGFMATRATETSRRSQSRFQSDSDLEVKSRLYLETTIPSYLTSWPSRDLIVAGRPQLTREWWETRRGTFQPYVSQLLVDEAGAGDPVAARKRLAVLQNLPLLDITPEVVEVASSILASGRVRRQFADGLVVLSRCRAR